jgi:hypothetical protein
MPFGNDMIHAIPGLYSDGGEYKDYLRFYRMLYDPSIPGLGPVVTDFRLKMNEG